MKPIKTKQEYQKLLKEFESFFGSEIPDNKVNRFDELADALEVYETLHYDIGPPTVIGALKFRMEQGKLNQSDVARIAGISRSRVSEILSGKREPSKNIIRRLHDNLGIPLDHLLQANDSEKPTRTAGEKNHRLRLHNAADNHS